MKNRTKIVLLLFLVIVFAYSLSIWAAYSPAVYDYREIHNRSTNDDVLFAFATALRINNPAAYDMIDPGVKPRLDEWMNTHQIQKCKNVPYTTLIWPATKFI